MANRWLLALALALFSLTAYAGGAGSVRKQTEASMLVTGEIEVDVDGSVRKFQIDRPEKLPPGVVEFLNKNAVQWIFEPVTVDGKPAILRNKVSMLVVAKKREDGQYTIRLQAANFNPYEEAPGSAVSSKVMTPPRYPPAAAQNNASGTVYLVLKIGRDGRVEDSFAEQVNLTFIASENQMTYWRNILAKSALSTAKTWTFTPPTIGESAAEPYWKVRVPVSFMLENMQEPKYGRWEAYIPGPRQTIFWAGDDDANGSPEALAGGSLQQMGKQGLRLLTPLGPTDEG